MIPIEGLRVRHLVTSKQGKFKLLQNDTVWLCAVNIRPLYRGWLISCCILQWSSSSSGTFSCTDSTALCPDCSCWAAASEKPFWCRPKPETLRRRREEKKAVQHARKGRRGAARFEAPPIANTGRRVQSDVSPYVSCCSRITLQEDLAYACNLSDQGFCGCRLVMHSACRQCRRP